MSDSIALYIHVPFCRRKCGYCSFISYAGREADIPAYITAVKQELLRRSQGQRVGSVYFGGGTPSLLPASQIGDILLTARSAFAVDSAAELNIEINPATVDLPYLESIRKFGVNRLSIGVQSLNDRELALMGRLHTAAEAINTVRLARESGFDNINLDFIYGLPGQTLSDWQDTLEKALALAPEHLSLYGLSLETGTPMAAVIEQGQLPRIDPDLSAGQYELAEDMLAARGYLHYEISNWAKKGYECRHNLVYWQNTPYLGIGAAAHSYVDGHRLANTADIDAYMTTFANSAPALPDMDEKIGPELRLAEAVILGLRLGEGISLADIKKRYGVDILEYYPQQLREMVDFKLLERYDGHIRLTRRGRLLSNEVFWRFLPDTDSVSNSI